MKWKQKSVIISDDVYDEAPKWNLKVYNSGFLGLRRRECNFRKYKQGDSAGGFG